MGGPAAPGRQGAREPGDRRFDLPDEPRRPNERRLRLPPDHRRHRRPRERDADWATL